MARTKSHWLLALSGLLVAACGGDTNNGGSGSCGSIAGCGGDVVGTWTVQTACVNTIPTAADTANVGPECKPVIEGAIRASIVLPDSMSLQFLADGTYQVSGTYRISTTYDYTAACLSAQGFGAPSATTCASVASAMTAQVTSVTCTFSGGSCRCPATLQKSAADTGTYRTQGNDMIMDEADPTRKSSGPYCVSGTTLNVYQSGTSTISEMKLTR